MKIFSVVAAAIVMVSSGYARAEKLIIPETVQLQPLSSELRSGSIEFGKLVSSMNKGQVWGESQKYGPCFGNGDLVWGGGRSPVDLTKMGEIFYGELAKAGFSSSEAQDSQLTDYVVSGSVNSASGRLCHKMAGFGNYDVITGEVIFTIEWRIYSSGSKELIEVIETKAGGAVRESAEGGHQFLYEIAFEQSVKQLINDKSFRAAVIQKMN